MRAAGDDSGPAVPADMREANQEAAFDQDKGRPGSPVPDGSGGKVRSGGSRPHSAASSSGSDAALGIKANGTYFRVPTAFALQLVLGQELPLQLQVGDRAGPAPCAAAAAVSSMAGLVVWPGCCVVASCCKLPARLA
jgi:hypothetical protein